MMDAVDPGNAFAEKLGQWIHFADAIALSAVHGESMASLPKARPDARDAGRSASVIGFERVRGSLVNSIMKSFSSTPGKTHITLPAPALELPLDVAAAYAPYRRFYEAHQRDMEMSIQPLRTNVRDAVAKMSPNFKKLSDLDALLEKILRDREAKLLAKVPVLLRRRFEQLFKEHQQELAATQQIDNPAGWTQPGGWLARFCNDMQTLLLAEAELRLQPTLGLIEAIKQDTQ
jgi:hypothetical protein